jgi:hypothetical protein
MESSTSQAINAPLFLKRRHLRKGHSQCQGEHLDNEHLEALKEELIEMQQLATDQEDRILVWTREAGSTASDPTSGGTADAHHRRYHGSSASS